MVEVMSRCPVCGARVYVGRGSPTPSHLVDDKECTGTGRPST
jgi:hypothetical protein